MIDKISNIPIIHGENGITVTFFYDLCKNNKINYFLEQIRWKNKKIHLSSDADDIKCHIFPSFGRGSFGMGEPDAVIVGSSFVLWIEVETCALRDLSKTFYNQFANFIKIGEQIENDTRKRFLRYYKFEDYKKVRGGYNTRKFISDLLKRKREAFYLVIADDEPNVVEKLYDNLCLQYKSHPRIINALSKLGWLSLRSVQRFNCLNKETKKVIRFNIT